MDENVEVSPGLRGLGLVAISDTCMQCNHKTTTNATLVLQRSIPFR